MKKYYLILAGLMIVIGFYARFDDLAWHFTHIDDVGVARTILSYRYGDEFGLFAPSIKSTYSPFQYLFTSLLLNFDQSYRELLFWGRLPSCIFSILSLLFYFFLVRKLDKDDPWSSLIGLAIFTLSLENIIMAKFMGNYALGVLALVLLMILLVDELKKNVFSLKRLLMQSFFLAIFCTMQYSILFFIPAYFLTVFLRHLKWAKYKMILTLNYILGGIFFLAMVFPVWFYFLRGRADAGITFWNKGPKGVFMFMWQDGMDIMDKIIYTAKFFVLNTFYIIQSNTAFIPEDHPLFFPVSVGLTLVLLLGIIRFVFTKDNVKKFLGIFMGASYLVWCVLVVLQKLTLSPTRHSLIWLPVMALLISEGVAWMIQPHRPDEVTNKRPAFKFTLVCGLTVFIVLLFSLNFSEFLQKRKDPFVESKIFQTLKENKVDSIIMDGWTNQIEVMKSIREFYNYFERDVGPFALICNGPQPYRKIAWISHRVDLDPKAFQIAQARINNYLIYRGRNFPLLRAPLSDYHIVFKEVMETDVEFEFSKKTKNGSNSIYFYILEKIN